MARRRDGVKGPKIETKVEASSTVVGMLVKNDKCSRMFALLVEKIRWFLPNRLLKNRSIVASVLYPNYVTTIRSFNVETFFGFSAWEGFLLYGKSIGLNAKG